MAITEENIPSAKGRADASPRSTSPLAPLCLAASFATETASYSRLVTRAERRRSSRVVAPGPAPTSSTWSPSEQPERSHGSSLRSVMYLQSDEPQNQISNRFIELPTLRHFQCIRSELRDESSYRKTGRRRPRARANEPACKKEGF